MPRTTRGVLAQAALVITLMAFPAEAGGVSGDQATPSDPPVPPAASCDLCATINRLSDAVSYEDEAERRRKAEDLAAQKSMAASAELMVGPARGQFWVGLVSVIGLIGSLGLSLLALAFTRDALKQQRVSAERQLRAYVGVREIVVKDVAVGVEPDVTIVFYNHGATPAYKVEEEVNFIFVPSGTPLPFNRDKVETSVTINPGETSKTYCAANGHILSADDIAALTLGPYRGGAMLLVTAHVTYETFDVRRTLEYAAAHYGATGAERYLITDHNWAN